MNNLNSKKRINLDQILMIFTLFTVGFLLYKNFTLSKEVTDLTDQNFIISQRNDLINQEIEVQKNTLGKKINVDSLNFIKLSHNYLGKKNYKIMILADLGSCQPCYIDAVNYYSMLRDTSNEFSKVDMVLVIQSRNIEYPKKILKNIENKNMSIFIDKDLLLKDLLKLNNSWVILLDSNNNCVYSYLLEKNNHLVNIERSEIIRNFLQTANTNKKL